MTKIIGESLVTGVVGILLTFLTNAGLKALFGQDGNVTIGPVITLNGNSYTPIIITNYSSSAKKNLRIVVPNGTQVRSIISNPPVRMDTSSQNPSNPELKKITISEIEGKRVTTLYVPLQDPNIENLVGILNAEEIDLTLQSYDDVQSPTSSIVTELIVNAVLYGVFISLGAFFVLKHWQSRDEEIEKLLRESVDSGKANQEKIERLQANSNKLKILLLARMNDYSKELSFWRNTVRKAVVSKTNNKDDAENLIREISNTLKTYQTLKDDYDFETIKTLALLLKDSPSKNQDT